MTGVPDAAAAEIVSCPSVPHSQTAAAFPSRRNSLLSLRCRRTTPGDMFGGMPRPRKSDSTKFYKLLGVEQSASAAEIKKVRGRRRRRRLCARATSRHESRLAARPGGALVARCVARGHAGRDGTLWGGDGHGMGAGGAALRPCGARGWTPRERTRTTKAIAGLRRALVGRAVVCGRQRAVDARQRAGEGRSVARARPAKRAATEALRGDWVAAPRGEARRGAPRGRARRRCDRSDCVSLLCMRRGGAAQRRAWRQRRVDWERAGRQDSALADDGRGAGVGVGAASCVELIVEGGWY